MCQASARLKTEGTDSTLGFGVIRFGNYDAWANFKTQRNTEVSQRNTERGKGFLRFLNNRIGRIASGKI
jgi:hypothetical protein